MKASRKFRLWACIAGGITLAMAAAAYIVTRTEPLLQSARTFCVVPPWINQRLVPGVSYYYWQSDHTALIVPDDQHTRSSKLFRVELGENGRAGRLTPVPLSISVPAGCVSVSPNGQYLAYVDRYAGSDRYLRVQRIDGGRLIECPWGPEPGRSATSVWPLVWSPDSSSLCEFRPRPLPCIRRFTIATERVDQFPLSADMQFANPNWVKILGFTGPDTVLIDANDDSVVGRLLNVSQGRLDQESPHLALIEVSLSQPTRVIRALIVPTPSIGFGEVVLSPKGDRLLLGSAILQGPYLVTAFLHRYAPFVPAESSIVERAWVCSLDGGNLKDLGSYRVEAPANPPNTPGAYPWILDPKWTPDGKRISFVFKDRLMTVPAE